VESCRHALADFELQYPVSFALELEQLVEEKPAETDDPRETRRGFTNLRMPDTRHGQPISQQPMAVRLGMRRMSGGTDGRSTPTKGGGGVRTANRGGQRRKTLEPESDKPKSIISDEADSYKKLRRQTHYRECSRHFIRYFTDAGILQQVVNCFKLPPQGGGGLYAIILSFYTVSQKLWQAVVSRSMG